MKVKKYLPSLLTLTNLFLGFLSILYIQRGDISLGCYLILIAAILDSLDGKLARKIGIASEFGKEIDSLADLISFCLAPSFLIFNIFYSSNQFVHEFIFIYLAVISSFPLLMGSIRLARFNVGHSQESKQSYFIGLPSPMSAIAICSIILLKINVDNTQNLNELFLFDSKNLGFLDINIIMPIVILLSFLMLGKIQFSKFPLLSFSYSKTNSIRLLILLMGILVLCISALYSYFHIGLFLFSSYYIISNIIFHFINNSIKLNQLRQKLKNKKSKK